MIIIQPATLASHFVRRIFRVGGIPSLKCRLWEFIPAFCRKTVGHPMGGWRQTLLKDRLQRKLRRYKYAKLVGISPRTLKKAD